MPVIRGEDIAKREVIDGAKGVHMQEFITAKDGAPTFALRVFEVAPGGFTPHHAHPWEHENFVLEGEGELVNPDATTTQLRVGDAAFVPSLQKHQYRNTGKGIFRLICCIPVQETCSPGTFPAQN